MGLANGGVKVAQWRLPAAASALLTTIRTKCSVAFFQDLFREAYSEALGGDDATERLWHELNASICILTAREGLQLPHPKYLMTGRITLADAGRFWRDSSNECVVASGAVDRAAELKRGGDSDSSVTAEWCNRGRRRGEAGSLAAATTPCLRCRARKIIDDACFERTL